MKRAGIARHSFRYASTAVTCVALLAIEPCFADNKKPSSRGMRAPRATSQADATSRRAKAGAAKGVVARYSQAMQLYDAGKFAEALVAFDQIHRAYPAHEPTTIQYAKTLYRLDRIPDNLFARVNPQYLDPETSYEYGYAFYTQNKFFTYSKNLITSFLTWIGYLVDPTNTVFEAN